MDEAFGYCYYRGWEVGSLLRDQESRAAQSAHLAAGVHCGANACPTPCGQADCHYNEIVLDGPSWRAHLPHIIEAVFLTVGADADCYGHACDRSMGDVHRDFLRAFGLDAAAVPLVVYDLKKARDGQPPFRLASADEMGR